MEAVTAPCSLGRHATVFMNLSSRSEFEIFPCGVARRVERGSRRIKAARARQRGKAASLDLLLSSTAAQFVSLPSSFSEEKPGLERQGERKGELAAERKRSCPDRDYADWLRW